MCMGIVGNPMVSRLDGSVGVIANSKGLNG